MRSRCRSVHPAHSNPIALSALRSSWAAHASPRAPRRAAGAECACAACESTQHGRACAARLPHASTHPGVSSTVLTTSVTAGCSLAKWAVCRSSSLLLIAPMGHVFVGHDQTHAAIPQKPCGKHLPTFGWQPQDTFSTLRFGRSNGGLQKQFGARTT